MRLPFPPPAPSPVLPADTEQPAGFSMPPLDAWLHRHQSSGAVCMTAGLLAWFEGPAPRLGELRELVAARWGAYERLRLVAGPDRGDPRTWPWWTPAAAFDPEWHVTEGPPGGLAGVAGHLLAQPMGRDRPAWRLHLLPAAGGFALLLCCHHALLDGMSMVTLVRALLDQPTGVPGQRSLPGPAPGGPGRFAVARALADLVPRARPLPFHGPVDSRRVVSWCRVPAADLGAAREALPSGRASANAVFLAATAGALQAAGVTGRLRLPGVCAMVPVDVRSPGGPAPLGNHYAAVRVPLPMTGSPLRRLAAVDAFTRRAGLKRRARAQALLVASRPHRYGAVGEALGRYADSCLYSSLLCSSLATHAGPLGLGRARLTGIAALPSLSPGHPVAVTMSLHDGGATLTVVSDQGHRRIAERLPALIGQEILALCP
ncbi:wax ester/triacylglycerol synthase domain-containing protein [Streptomyces sp. NPDC049555]|uniref:wax ester/triacylglycerol synthase domain-containing protein n=1 Tax=unclassified Streptomyces TaxID=2593676 RepID=UPI00341A44E5